MRMVASWLPVMTCGSGAWLRMLHTVLSWPDRQNTWALVRISHTRQVLSRPPVNSTSSCGCRARE